MKKLIEPLLWGLAAAALLYGAFEIGQRVERKWWRSELAAKSAAVQATMSKLGAEAEGLDVSLLRTIEGDRAKLEDAEATIRTLQARKPQVAPAMAPDDPCRPVPAQCLRRGG